MRDEPHPDVTFTVPKEGGTLQILIENFKSNTEFSFKSRSLGIQNG